MSRVERNSSFPGFLADVCRIGLFLIVALTVTPTILLAEEPTDDSSSPDSGRNTEESDDEIPAEWVALIEALGSPDFATRQAAQMTLTEIGPPVLPTLERFRNVSDHEVASRIAALIQSIGRIAFRERVDAFAKSDTDTPSLPGWSEFRRRVGSGPKEKAFFVKMATAEPKMFQLWEENKTDKLQALFASRVGVLRQIAQYSKGTDNSVIHRVATLYFLGASRDFETQPALFSTLYSLSYTNPLREVLNNAEKEPILRKLVENWLSMPSEQYLSPRITLGLSNNLKSCRIPARFLIRNTQIRGSQLQYAILALGKFGDASDLILLESLLSNDDVVRSKFTRNGKNYSSQVRDCALAVLLKRTGQKPETYDLLAVENSRYGFSPYFIGFPSKESRKEAFKKWTDWRKDNPRSVPVRAARPKKAGDRQQAEAAADSA